MVLNAFPISFAVYTIIQFYSRVKQIRFTHFLLILQLIQILVIVFDVEKLSNVAGQAHMITFGVFSVIPALQLLFTRLATGAIKKDEALVRSADRLR